MVVAILRIPTLDPIAIPITMIFAAWTVIYSIVWLQGYLAKKRGEMQIFRIRVARFECMSLVNIILVISIPIIMIIVYAALGLTGNMPMDYVVSIIIGEGIFFVISVIFYGYFYCVIKTYNDIV